MLSEADQRYLQELSPWADIAGSVLACLALPSFSGSFDETRLCSEAGLPATQNVAVIGLLQKLRDLGLVAERPGMQWQIGENAAVIEKLSPLFDAIGYYRERIHRDHTTASVVLTRPGQPSKLEEALSTMGVTTGRMEVTTEAFGDIAISARKRLVVMTPFLDQHGARWLSEIIKKAKPDVRKAVILRYLQDASHPSYPDGFVALGSALAEFRVEVFDYAVARPAGTGTETFHAKCRFRKI